MSFSYTKKTPSPGGGGFQVSGLSRERSIFDWWSQDPTKEFIPPTPTQVIEYFESKGSDKAEALHFFVFNDRLNWSVAGVQLVTWKTSAAMWLKRSNARKLK